MIKQPPVKGMSVIPCGLDLPLMDGFWASCLETMIAIPEVRKQFRSDTGHDLDSLVNCSRLDKMIDDATGRTREIMVAWCDWATINYWGIEQQKAPG